MAGMSNDLQPKTTSRWPLVVGVLLLLWGGGAIATGYPSPIAWLVALLGIALLAVGLLRRP